jgi:hypothetical protein
VLENKGYSYKEEGDNLVVNRFSHPGDINLGALTSLPPGIVFNNPGGVYLPFVTSLPPGVEFSNRGNVNLASIVSISPDVLFRNIGSVYLDSMIGGYFQSWKGNIEGIGNKRLLNKMISLGLFER